ncbi:hypothetical protein EYF80_042750 [Liparis tanakae]|uniref:Uncharacterized protein n=1 Tax=Liparis tanakae TaxID=230148 RepID=A0A4Z2G0I9_9TELE|nr:hypothetical protein EYF80_042750 [Liparis tanakae]
MELEEEEEEEEERGGRRRRRSSSRPITIQEHGDRRKSNGGGGGVGGEDYITLNSYHQDYNRENKTHPELKAFIQAVGHAHLCRTSPLQPVHSQTSTLTSTRSTARPPPGPQPDLHPHSHQLVPLASECFFCSSEKTSMSPPLEGKSPSPKLWRRREEQSMKGAREECTEGSCSASFLLEEQQEQQDSSR